MDKISKEAFDRAVEVLKLCETKYGFYAANPGYQGVWARDSIITSLGASLFNDFRKPFERSLIILGKYQSEKGQIPNAIFPEKNPIKVDYLSIDSSLWYLIGHDFFKRRYNDNTLYKKEKDKIDRAFNWLTYQDMSEDYMLEQNPTTDWQDAFPHRYGHTINTQALWYKVLKLKRETKNLNKLKHNVNINNDVKLWDNDYYLAYRWKNHGKYKEKGEWFDSLGNLLAIIFDLASEQQSKKIISYIEKNKINFPYPLKSIYPPITKESKYWQDYYKDCLAKTPNYYSNSGIWTYIGGFYVLALIKQKQYNKANKELVKLAEANLIKPVFSEWLHGKSGKSFSTSGNQAWNAGMFVLAYNSCKLKKVLI